MIRFVRHLFGRSIAVRLAWIAASFLIPIGVLFNIYVAAADKDIVFATREVAGNSFVRRLMDAVRPVLAHRALANRGKAGEEKARRLRLEVDQALDALDREGDRAGTMLEFTAEGLKARKREGNSLADLRREWESLKGEAQKLKPAEADDRHQRVIEILYTMIGHVTDTSNLILDPDLDSYYIMDATTAALPALARRLADIQGRLAMGDKGPANQLEIAILSRRAMEDDLSRAEKGVETAISEDDRFNGSVDSLKDLGKVMTPLRQSVEEAIKGEAGATGDTRFADAVDRTIMAQATLTDQLDILLNRRITNFSSMKTRGTVLLAGALAFAIALVIWIGYGIIRPMSRGADELTDAADQQRKTSISLTGNAEETSTQAQVVSAAAEQVSANVRSVAAAAEEMDATIREVAAKAHQAARVATDAVDLAQSTGGLVSRLGDSGARIGGVVKLITSIAEQTNLLALNATIEAARAGEVGKGFAVVANEVKELAKETAKATEDISSRIGAIQKDTEEAVRAITEIQGTIRRISEIQSAIASAVEEQSATTREIGRNVTEAARGTSDIASNIAGVASAARNTSSGAHQLSSSAEGLLGLAGAMRSLIGGSAQKTVNMP